jgi:hypothetical protein
MRHIQNRVNKKNNMKTLYAVLKRINHQINHQNQFDWKNYNKILKYLMFLLLKNSC